MNRIHPLYAMILNRLLDRDMRDIMPDRMERFDEIAKFITDDSESETDVIEINPEDYE